MADDEEPEREKADPPAPLGVAEWMVTYGDMMTLLLCFFVLLFIFSKSDSAKYIIAVGSIQEAFGVQNRRPESPFAAYSPTPTEHQSEAEAKAESDLYSTIQEVVGDIIQRNPDLQQSLRVQTEDKGVIVRIASERLFMPGTAEMSNDATLLLRPVLDAANKHNYNILVRNNTIQSDVNAELYPTVWELSGARAAAAVRSLIVLGKLPPSRLKAMGLGDSAPLLPPTDSRSNSINNRTEFLFYQSGRELW